MADYAGVLADLKTRRAALSQELSELDDVIKGIERLVAKTVGGTPATPTASKVTRTPLPQLTMPIAVELFFRTYAKHERQTTRQVMEAVKAQGIKARKTLRGHVYNTLDRLSKDNGPYVHHSDGRWSLREWNLGETTANQPLLR
jgi:hypothetical protein